MLECIQVTFGKRVSNFNVLVHVVGHLMERWVLANIEVSPTFVEKIKVKQFEDESFNELRKNAVIVSTQDTTRTWWGVQF